MWTVDGEAELSVFLVWLLYVCGLVCLLGSAGSGASALWLLRE